MILNLAWVDSVKDVQLIEPSLVALARAKAIVTCCFPEANFTAINKRFDNLDNGDIALLPKMTKLHLFSNIIDINNFGIAEMLRKILGASRKTCDSGSRFC